MAPKKQKGQKMGLTDFLLNEEFGSSSGNWADDVEDEIKFTSDSQIRTFQTQKSHPNDSIFGRPGFSERGDYGRDRPFFAREPRPMPDAPPYKAHVSGLPNDVPEESLPDAVREAFGNFTIRDMSPVTTKGESRFMFITFETRDDLVAVAGDSPEPIFVADKKVFVSVADRRDNNRRPLQDGRDLDWSRKGPLPPDPSRGQFNDRRPGGFERRGPSDFGGDRMDRQPSFGERRGPREDAPPSRVIDWSQRQGPLSPLADERPASRSNSRPAAGTGGYDMGSRSGSYRGGERRGSPAWPEGREGGSRPPRRDFSERPERTPSAAELDNSWRSHMRPDPARSTTSQSRDGSEAPPSPSGSTTAAAVTVRPGGRPVLNLAKRTVSEAPDIVSPAPPSASSKSNPFGAARPIDTTAREREIEEKREAQAKAKREAEQKTKEERIAKEKEAKEKEAAEAAQAAQATQVSQASPAADPDSSVDIGTAPENKEAVAKDTPEPQQAQSAAPVAKEERPAAAGPPPVERRPTRPREFREREPSYPKSRATESSNWRSASGEQRGPRGPPSGPRRSSNRGGGGRGFNSERGPRSNGSGPVVEQSQPPAQNPQTPAPPTPTPQEDDGWTTVTKPQKSRGGRQAA